MSARRSCFLERGRPAHLLLLQGSPEAIHQAEEMEIPASVTKYSLKKKKKNTSILNLGCFGI